MKKILYTLAFLLFSVAAFAQVPDCITIKQTDTIIPLADKNIVLGRGNIRRFNTTVAGKKIINVKLPNYVEERTLGGRVRRYQTFADTLNEPNCDRHGDWVTIPADTCSTILLGNRFGSWYVIDTFLTNPKCITNYTANNGLRMSGSNIELINYNIAPIGAIPIKAVGGSLQWGIPQYWRPSGNNPGTEPGGLFGYVGAGIDAEVAMTRGNIKRIILDDNNTVEISDSPFQSNNNGNQDLYLYSHNNTSAGAGIFIQSNSNISNLANFFQRSGGNNVPGNGNLLINSNNDTIINSNNTLIASDNLNLTGDDNVVINCDALPKVTSYPYGATIIDRSIDINTINENGIITDRISTVTARVEALPTTAITTGNPVGFDNLGNLVPIAAVVNTDNQNLSITGQSLSISGGNTVMLPDNQNLSIAGSDLTIDNGNTVTLPFWQPTGDDSSIKPGGLIGYQDNAEVSMIRNSEPMLILRDNTNVQINPLGTNWETSTSKSTIINRFTDPAPTGENSCLLTDRISTVTARVEDLPTMAIVPSLPIVGFDNLGNLVPTSVDPYNAGSGINITGQTITNTGDLNATNEIQTLSISGQNITLSLGGGTVTLPAAAATTANNGLYSAAGTIKQGSFFMQNTRIGGNNGLYSYTLDSLKQQYVVAQTATTPTKGELLISSDPSKGNFFQTTNKTTGEKNYLTVLDNFNGGSQASPTDFSTFTADANSVGGHQYAAMRVFDAANATDGKVYLGKDTIILDNQKIIMPDYPSTRNDAGTAVNFLATDANGNVVSNPVTDLAGSTPLSSVTASISNTSIDNLNFSENWVYSTLTTGNAFTIATPALTTGTGLRIQNASSAINSTNGLLNVVNATATTTGVLATLQSNSAVGSGVTVLTNGNTGFGTSAPLSTIEINGSYGYKKTVVSALAYTATATDNLIILTLPSTVQTVSLPIASGATGRQYTITNTGIEKAISTYIDKTGLTTTVIPSGGTIVLYSDGSSWIQISGDVQKVRVIVNGTAGFTTSTGGINAAVFPVFSTVTQNTHNAYSNTTGVFVAPRTGLYAIQAVIELNSSIWIAPQELRLQTSGSGFLRNTLFMPSGTYQGKITLSGTQYLTAGQSLSTQIRTSNISGIGGSTSTTYNSLSIFEL